MCAFAYFNWEVANVAEETANHLRHLLVMVKFEAEATVDMVDRYKNSSKAHLPSPIQLARPSSV